MFQQGPWVTGWGDELDPKTDNARILYAVQVSEIIWPEFSAQSRRNRPAHGAAEILPSNLVVRLSPTGVVSVPRNRTVIRSCLTWLMCQGNLTLPWDVHDGQVHRFSLFSKVDTSAVIEVGCGVCSPTIYS
jgi:hypothetical protein